LPGKRRDGKDNREDKVPLCTAMAKKKKKQIAEGIRQKARGGETSTRVKGDKDSQKGRGKPKRENRRQRQKQGRENQSVKFVSH